MSPGLEYKVSFNPGVCVVELVAFEPYVGAGTGESVGLVLAVIRCRSLMKDGAYVGLIGKNSWMGLGGGDDTDRKGNEREQTGE
jgi:hypothetical protein